jgi:outer membrane protein assembly factor BamD (BamD/ComL family)
MEANINELVRKNKPQEAIAVAEELIKTYPLSPQAQIATQLVAKLKERLESQESGPA